MSKSVSFREPGGKRRTRRILSLMEATMLVVPRSVQEQYDKVIMRRSHELMDFTNYAALRRNLQSTLLATIDSFVWSLYNLWILFLFAVCSLIWPVVETIAKFFKIVSFRMGYVYDSPNSRKAPPLALSAVCFMDPNFHTSYRPDWAKLHPLLTRRGSRDKEAAFDTDLAEFLLHLSALAYESNEVVADVITFWNDPVLDLHYCRFGHEGLIMVVLYSVPGQFVVPSFKGTSPFDLNEWLIDCSLRKTAAKNSLLPGLVHSGFYDAFGFPKNENVTCFDLDPMDDWTIESLESGQAPILTGLGAVHPSLSSVPRPIQNSAMLCKIRGCVDAFRQRRRHLSGMVMVRDGFWDHIEDEFRAIVKKFAAAGAKKPSLIMTGHSLGGATATMFSSLLLWRRSGAPTSVVRLNWDACFRLEGCMTFGTPRPGDTTWSDAIEAVRTSVSWTPPDQPLFYCYRVINGCDFVATCPISPRIDCRWTVDVDGKQPTCDGALSLLDSRHLGTPILLHARSKQQQFRASYVQRERALSDFIPNYIGSLRSLTEVVRRGNWTNLALGVLKLLIIPSLIIDHAPVEYAANMGRQVTPI